MKIRAQGALEYLLMIGASILVVAIVIIAISGVIGETNDQNSGSSYTDQMGGLKGFIFNMSADPKETTHDIFESNRAIKINQISFESA